MTNKQSRGSSTAAIIIIIIIIVLGAIGLFYYQNMRVAAPASDQNQPESKNKVTATSTATLEIKEPSCDFDKDYKLKTTEKYGIFGDDEFETAVCGYLKTEKEEIFGEEVETAYFMIKDFMDDGFKNALTGGMEMGNTVNKMVDGDIAVTIGCMEKGAIVNFSNTEIDPDAQKAILASSEQSPVRLIFGFKKHEGFGVACGGLMEAIKLY